MSEPKRPEPDTLKAKIKSFPDTPGVYIMRDASRTTLYVGKAGSLKRRVASYFSSRPDSRALMPTLLKKVADVDYLVTTTETEALILENNLIKKHHPPYNVRLRDDKTYVSIKVTVKDTWPRVMTTRRIADDGAVYFGPFASAAMTREVVRLIKHVFTLRTCSPGFFKARRRPCIQYEIGRCCAPCVGLVTEDVYQHQVEEVLQLLRGHAKPVLKRLEQEMAEASARLDFERAALVRDRIQALQRVLERQTVQAATLGDVDVFGVHGEGRRLTVQALFVRDGRVLDAAPFHLRAALPLPEALRSFLAHFYLAGRYIPPEIVVPVLPDDLEVLRQILRKRRGGSIRFLLGRRGERRALLDLATQNDIESARGALDLEEQRAGALKELAMALSLPSPPHRIECFDISTTGGTHAVGSMVVMIDGEPSKEDYRHFRIRHVAGMDDYAMLDEVLTRRLKDEAARPDLIVVDGGRGQVARAAHVLLKLGRADIALAGLAKKRLRGREKTTERVFVPEATDPLPLAEDAPGSRLLQALRDEAHRFAITYHRKLRRQRALTSDLEQVKGLGKQRIRTLFEHVGGFAQLRKLSPDELAEKGKLPHTVAQALYVHLHPKTHE